MIVCSFNTISVESAFGLLTLDAIAVESVSMMILHTTTYDKLLKATFNREEGTHAPVIDRLVQAQHH